MLALFDSGRGGLNTVAYLNESNDGSDLIYLIDGNNAPYGIRTENEIIGITSENIRRLQYMGAERVLIACCTASTVHRLLPKEYRSVSIPIIDAIAKEAKTVTRTGRIGVIATERTVSSGAFQRALKGYSVDALPLSELVPLIDGGLSDTTVTEPDTDMLSGMLKPILKGNIDTLILGCTHFPAVKETIRKITSSYGDIRLIDSARVGADTLRKYKYGK